MTTPRTMTQSQFEKHLHIAHKGFGPVEFHECLRTCGGVTIVPNSEPRPDFEAMTKWELIEWCYENYNRDRAVFSEQYRYIRRAIIDFANEIADRKGMGR